VPELAMLAALWALEPRGDAREDLRIAHQTLILGNLILGAVGAKRKLKLDDVLLRFDRRGDPEDPETAIAAVMAALTASAVPEG
jgi:hypothetical protein